MSHYRRFRVPGGIYFFTVVTYRHRLLFDKPIARQWLHEAVVKARKNHPFAIDAWVLLPNHLHCLWTLPEGDSDYSTRWNLIKSEFSKKAKEQYHKPEWMNASKRKHRESTFWQRRGWEHVIRDERDYEKHFEYIHYNPVKHGWAEQVKDWPYSTFHRYVRQDVYPENRGGEVEDQDGALFGDIQ
ncbi:MAG: transposase [Gammaproteobacteria bacterium]|nr:transposase [Gammaproteobacteria bacterium]